MNPELPSFARESFTLAGPMASTYDLIEYDSDDEHVAGYTHHPQANLDSAAKFVTELLEKSGLEHALMGGYALYVSGSERTTENIDIAVGASMRELWKLVIPESR